MKIIWSPSARADLISIRAYIGQDNPKAATEMRLSCYKYNFMITCCSWSMII